MTVYTIKGNLIRYRSVIAPSFYKFGHPYRISKANKRVVIEWIKREG